MTWWTVPPAVPSTAQVRITGPGGSRMSAGGCRRCRRLAIITIYLRRAGASKGKGTCSTNWQPGQEGGRTGYVILMPVRRAMLAHTLTFFQKILISTLPTLHAQDHTPTPQYPPARRLCPPPASSPAIATEDIDLTIKNGEKGQRPTLLVS